ncbi:MAG: ABC transporter substrate-binding protein [Oscillospiraceae bacterium]|nr:ABC transporter substrate-binding protein [Oscillospiraceae bacterium]
MKARRLLATLLVLALALTLCACAAKPAPEPPKAAEIAVTDMIGREVTVVPGSYQRVVCIGAGALRMYCYVGDTALLCGVEDIDNTSLEDRPKMFDGVGRPYLIAFEDVFKTLPSCGVGGPNAQTAEAEKILACNPDIVISEYEDVDKENALQEQLGVPVITMKAGPNSVFDPAFADSMTLLGKIFGREARAAELLAYIDGQKADITARTKDLTGAPSVYICGLGNWGTANHLSTAPNYIAFDVANITNAAADLEGKGVRTIEEEMFVALGDKMDIIIMDAAAVKNIKPLYAEDPAMFDTCKAWADGEVYLQMAFNAYYTNFELALINTWFAAKTAYPEAFEDIDITAKTDEVTEAFLGQKLAEKLFAYPNSFGGYQKIDVATFFG